MSLRAQLQARLDEAVAKVRVLRTVCRTAGRYHLRNKKRKAGSSSSARKTRLLALADVYADSDEDIVGLIAVVLRAATVEEATGAVADSIHESSLADSRHVHLVIWARMASKTVPVRALAAKAQRLVAEARVAVWMRQMNRNGVAPMGQQLVRRLLQEWPAVNGATVDQAWQQRLRTSAAVHKKWIQVFTDRWGCKWQALPARGAVEGEERRRREALLISSGSVAKKKKRTGSFFFDRGPKKKPILRTVFGAIF